jgi:hypothetical protein
MKLIKINPDYYIIVDDSEIKEGDWYYWEITKTIQIAKLDSLNRLPKNSDGSKKITHSTKPLEDIPVYGEKSIDIPLYTVRGFTKIKPLNLSEVKELIGEVDVKKKIISPYPINTQNDVDWCNGYQTGYNQALEDNKEKKYTEDDVIRIVEKSRETGLTAEYLILSLQPKTEWEVEFIDDKLKLV